MLAAAAACTAVGALAVWAYTSDRRQAAPPLSGSVSVAVLPFTSSPDHPDAIKAGLGFSESLVSALEGLSSVTVLSKPDFSDYLADAADRVKGAGELGVAAVVTGVASAVDSRREFAIRVEQPGGLNSPESNLRRTDGRPPVARAACGRRHRRRAQREPDGGQS